MSGARPPSPALYLQGFLCLAPARRHHLEKRFLWWCSFRPRGRLCGSRILRLALLWQRLRRLRQPIQPYCLLCMRHTSHLRLVLQSFHYSKEQEQRFAKRFRLSVCVVLQSKEDSLQDCLFPLLGLESLQARL